MPIFTDLAVEGFRGADPHIPALSGIDYDESRTPPLPWERVRVKTKEAARAIGKETGDYLTVRTGALWLDDRDFFREKLFSFRALLQDFFSPLKKGGTVLVAGLGNRGVTCDAIGPQAVKNLIVTRHIRSSSPLTFENLGLCDLCAITPGVLGQTGIESGDVVQSVAQKIRPDLVVVIDALASRALERLVKTVQVSDTGLAPGAGVGNRRPEITPEKVGAPVVSIGVPTVVDAATLTLDLASRCGGKPDEEKLRLLLSENKMNYYVTPRETDEVIRATGAFLGYAVNLTLNENLSYEDMLSLIG